MLVTWNEAKRLENWERRKVDFQEAALIFADPSLIESRDRRREYGEERVQALGQVDEAFDLVVYTWREDIRHLITAWKVGERGRRRYQALFAGRAEANESGRLD